MTGHDDRHHRAMHDIGGAEHGEFLIQEHEPTEFDKDVDTLVNLLASREVALVRPDERRRGIEELSPSIYFSIPYYQRWLFGVSNILCEKGILTEQEIAAEMDLLRDRGDI